MTIDHAYSDARPLQVRLSDDIRIKIETGEYTPGQKLPTLREIADEYACSIASVRKAVDLLRQQGLVVSRQGKGSFVRERPSSVRHSMERSARSNWRGPSKTTILSAESVRQDIRATRIIRDLAEVRPPKAVLDRLGTSPNERVWTRKRTVFLNGRPSQLADSYYPLDIANGTTLQEEETGPGGDFARLDEAGHTPSRIREEWTARMPTTPESSLLQLPDGTPVIDFTRTIFDQHDQPIEVMLSVIAGDTVSFCYEFPVPD